MDYEYISGELFSKIADVSKEPRKYIEKESTRRKKSKIYKK